MTSPPNSPKPGPPPSQRRAVVVLGMHRSGTSPLCRVLGLLGLQLPATPMIATEANRFGHWGESEPIYEVHEELFESAGLKWDDPGPLPRELLESEAAAAERERLLGIVADEYPGSDPILVKDPRICRLLELWRPLLAELEFEASYVIPTRNPLEVAASLERRDSIAPSHGLIMWLRHVLEGELGTRGMPRAFSTYEGLLADWRSELERISPQIDLDLRAADYDSAEQAVAGFLSGSERHHLATLAELEVREEVGAWVTEVYREMVAAREIGEPDREVLDRVRAELEDADRILAPVLSETTRRLTQTSRGLSQATEREAITSQRLTEAKGELADSQDQLAALVADPLVAPALRLRTALHIAGWLVPPRRGGLQKMREYLALRRSPQFDRGFYLRRYPEVAGAAVNPVVHYIEAGARQGLDPGPEFSSADYLSSHPELARRGVNPLFHHLKNG